MTIILFLDDVAGRRHNNQEYNLSCEFLEFQVKEEEEEGRRRRRGGEGGGQKEKIGCIT